MNCLHFIMIIFLIKIIFKKKKIKIDLNKFFNEFKFLKF